MPQASQLPDDLAGLARRQAVSLTHERFRSDVDRLTTVIERILEGKTIVRRSLGNAPTRELFADELIPPPPGLTRIDRMDGLEYVWIPSGRFWMGAVPGDADAIDNEKPRHKVTITKGFWLGRTAVTVAAYKRFVEAKNREMPEPPEFNRNWEHDDHPVVNVSWHDAHAYCTWVGGRLPTEAEWEYAARGGAEGLKFPWGEEIDENRGNYGGLLTGTCAVGMYPSNRSDLFDMAGNVWEWTADWFADYTGEEQTDPVGPLSGSYRVVRGGSWGTGSRFLRSSDRSWEIAVEGSVYVGFRCAREVFP